MPRLREFNTNMEVGKLKCYCHLHCPPEAAEVGICEVDIGGRCFALVQETINDATGLLEPEYSYGCFSAGDPAFLQCKGHLINHDVPTSIACCDTGDFCNERLKPVYKVSSPPFLHVFHNNSTCCGGSEHFPAVSRFSSSSSNCYRVVLYESGRGIVMRGSFSWKKF